MKLVNAAAFTSFMYAMISFLLFFIFSDTLGYKMCIVTYLFCHQCHDCGPLQQAVTWVFMWSVGGHQKAAAHSWPHKLHVHSLKLSMLFTWTNDSVGCVWVQLYFCQMRWCTIIILLDMLAYNDDVGCTGAQWLYRRMCWHTMITM